MTGERRHLRRGQHGPVGTVRLEEHPGRRPVVAGVLLAQVAHDGPQATQAEGLQRGIRQRPRSRRPRPPRRPPPGPCRGRGTPPGVAHLLERRERRGGARRRPHESPRGAPPAARRRTTPGRPRCRAPRTRDPAQAGERRHTPTPRQREAPAEPPVGEGAQVGVALRADDQQVLGGRPGAELPGQPFVDSAHGPREVLGHALGLAVCDRGTYGVPALLRPPRPEAGDGRGLPVRWRVAVEEAHGCHGPGGQHGTGRLSGNRPVSRPGVENPSLRRS